MRPLLYVVTFLAVLASGFWAYREHYDTRLVLREVSALNRQIASLREALSLQRAEWAYLNRPDRLRELSALNYDRLGLLPLDAAQFGSAAQISRPAVEEFFGDISQTVDVIGDQDAPESTP